MVIFKYELKNHRKYILGWAIALALCIFLMTPTYYSFLDAASVELFETMGTTDFYRSVGVSMEYLTSPLGIYGFLTSFFMIASGVFGMHFGISIHTRECTEGTSEYLFTKPFPRKTIYWAKALTVFIGVVIVAAVYSGSDEAGYSYCLMERGGDLRSFNKAMTAVLCGRGGGKPEYQQGSVKAEKTAIEVFFKENWT